MNKDKIRLSPAASILPNDEGVLLRSDLGDFQLHGKDISAFVDDIIPLLNGDFGLDEIASQITQYSSASVEQLLRLLEQKGLIERVVINSTSAPWPEQYRFINAWQNEAKRDPRTLQNNRILCIGLTPWAMPMLEELLNSGVGYIHILDDANCTNQSGYYHHAVNHLPSNTTTVDAFTDYLKQRFVHSEVSAQTAELNSPLDEVILQNWDLVVISLPSDSLSAHTNIATHLAKLALPTFYVSIDGLTGHVGPYVTNQGGGCWNCLRLRKLGTAINPQTAHKIDEITNKAHSGARAHSILSSMSASIAMQAATDIQTILLQYTQSVLQNTTRTTNLVSGESSLHPIIPVPECAVCSGPSEQDISSCNKALSAISELETVEQFKTMMRGWVDPEFGVIKQLTGHAPHLPELPVTASASLSSFTSGKFDPRTQGQVGSGKGLDSLSAHISAVGEALERYSAARYDIRNCRYATVNQLQGDYVNPADLVLYSPEQYATPGFPFSKWRSKQKIHWVEGSWIGTSRATWVPALVSYFNFTCPYEEQFSQVSSNGLAAGKDNEDAAVRACFELIERDAMMLTWYAQLPCTRLDADSLLTGKLKLMVESITQQGIALELYLLDVGIHIPTVVCLGLGDGFTTPAVSVSLATHDNINVAVTKALLEQGHVMPYLCSLMQSGHKAPQTVEQVRTLEDHAAFYFSSAHLSAFNFMRQPKSESKPLSCWSYPTLEGAADLRQRITKAGVDIAIVDVTASDVALSPFRVARAVGVNMQPIHFGEQFKRIDNPRLHKLLAGRAVNLYPHPIA
ncbi:TOMM precursor leader peptide-binding protein [Pseudoalteromonas maricaloris]|uniref:TOMM precursor leader peptide-binding protein n=1 Tax=Pseudoalteromonas maricaloris TaxID=184924 RepID=UPI00057D6F7F|nr:TOMM precursor leader peptide-binding protein [Pseudoalteromonas flavipulchra]KID34795.1 hypothetical protein QT15_17010 [Pseudoalteromonas flavipulchra NCIMB 2033 = ATCC BAA-314]MBD0781282.1 TOMM precursor leader peptide-binding protein [Pseudoalteromonas flavipulchra]MBE0372834.1 ribosomal protein S12 methylthiotransferase [Pseudoalteromonas flavipulchra NCIMB 2033 = ATCC BAA-314]